jgi:hypothetical protein
LTSRQAIRLPRVSTSGVVALAVAGKAAEWLTLAAILTLVPRMLGPADHRTFGVALAIVALGSASLALGAPAMMARFMAAAPPDERAALARVLALRAVRWRSAGLALIGAVVVALVLVDPGRFRPLHTLIVLIAIVLDAAATLAFRIALALDRPGFWSFRHPSRTSCSSRPCRRSTRSAG